MHCTCTRSVFQPSLCFKILYVLPQKNLYWVFFLQKCPKSTWLCFSHRSTHKYEYSSVFIHLFRLQIHFASHIHKTLFWIYLKCSQCTHEKMVWRYYLKISCNSEKRFAKSCRVWVRVPHQRVHRLYLADSLGTLLLVQPQNDSLDSGLGGQGGLDEGLLGVHAILCSSVSTGVTTNCPSCTNTGYCMYYVYVPWHERRTC
jgi:hypothetical protein